MKNNRNRAALWAAAAILSAVAAAAGLASALIYDGAVRVAGIALTAAGLTGLALSAPRALRREGERYTTAKYARKKSYVTPCEFDFLMRLRSIAPSRYEVLPQAALVSVIDKLTETSFRSELFRIVDYLFVDSATFAPLLLVELNDRSHLRADRKLRDQKVEEICRKAKMPLVSFTTAEAGDFAYVKKTVLSAILKK